MNKEIDVLYSAGLDSVCILLALYEVCPKDQLHVIMGKGHQKEFYPKLWEEIGKIASTLKTLGRAKLALTHGHPTLTADIQQLMEWNVGYSNVQPDIVKLIRQHYSDKIAELRSNMSKT